MFDESPFYVPNNSVSIMNGTNEGKANHSSKFYLSLLFLIQATELSKHGLSILNFERCLVKPYLENLNEVTLSGQPPTCDSVLLNNRPHASSQLG